MTVDSGLPPLPRLPAKEMRGPTEWSNWVIPGCVIAGAYPASMDDVDTEHVLTLLLELGINTFVCLQVQRSPSVLRARAALGGGAHTIHRCVCVRLLAAGMGLGLALGAAAHTRPLFGLGPSTRCALTILPHLGPTPPATRPPPPPRPRSTSISQSTHGARVTGCGHTSATRSASCREPTRRAARASPSSASTSCTCPSSTAPSPPTPLCTGMAAAGFTGFCLELRACGPVPSQQAEALC
jgi:hypothetical protein